MSDLQPDEMKSSAPMPALFATRTPEPVARSLVPFGIAGVVVLIVLATVLAINRHKPSAAAHQLQPLDAYAPSLPISGIVMSESTSLSGGKSTFIDGHVRNDGPKTVTAVEVQVLFANDEQLPAQLETLPLALIRTREPYVDTQPVSAAPIKPGEDREFRLIFEKIGSNWNQSLPTIRVIAVQ